MFPELNVDLLRRECMLLTAALNHRLDNDYILDIHRPDPVDINAYYVSSVTNSECKN